jgi:subtilase family serine protease
MASSSRKHRIRFTALAAGFAAASMCLADTGAAAPAWTDLGAVPASQSLHATVWLKRKDEAGFQSALKAIYDPASPSFHHWMTPAQYNSYMPDQDSLATLRDTLQQAGLTIEKIAADGRSIDVSANAATIERAFGASVHNFQAGSQTFLATTAKPALAGAPGALVAAITGLTTPRTRPFALRQIDQSTGKPLALTVSPQAVTTGASGSPLNPYLTDNCYNGNTLQALEAAEGDVTLIGRRQVNGYFAAGTGYGVCGYDATQLRAHYGLTGPVSRGLDGKGQTIAIVVAYGSPFIVSDANTYSTIMKLPQLGADNFQLIAPLGNPLTYDSGWSTETTIDVTMAHAIAPGAKIVLLVAPSNETADLLNTFTYAVEHQLADVVSN